jgi:hypothetical protein
VKDSAGCHSFVGVAVTGTTIEVRPADCTAAKPQTCLPRGACRSGRLLPGGIKSPDRRRCGGAAIAVSKGYLREYEVVKRQNETAAGAVDKTRRASGLMTIGKGLIVVVGMVAAFCRKAIGLLAEGATTAPADDPLNNAIRGGVMNHRTGKFDEGNDPAGWYERD